jgi:dTDP-4-amino-4,6-dideoxygalactose transaminase
VFNTFEGGAIVCRSAESKDHIDRLKNFGIVDELNVHEPGMNGKMSELNSAIGLLQLAHVSEAIAARETADRYYRDQLSDVVGIKIIEKFDNVKSNYSYFPILVESIFPVTRDRLFQILKEENIFTRRYFYPLISEFPLYKNLSSSRHVNLPVSVEIANKVLCLPIYPDLRNYEQQRIIDVIRGIKSGDA